MFGCEPLKVTVEAFHEDLHRLSEEIQARNQQLHIPYTYLQPEHVTNSISV
jgi:hypothetical protein